MHTRAASDRWTESAGVRSLFVTRRKLFHSVVCYQHVPIPTSNGFNKFWASFYSANSRKLLGWKIDRLPLGLVGMNGDWSQVVLLCMRERLGESRKKRIVTVYTGFWKFASLVSYREIQWRELRHNLHYLARVSSRVIIHSKWTLMQLLELLEQWLECESWGTDKRA